MSKFENLKNWNRFSALKIKILQNCQWVFNSKKGKEKWKSSYILTFFFSLLTGQNCMFIPLLFPAILSLLKYDHG